MRRRRLEEPNMSDNLLLVKVEDLINMAMGPADKNVVNFKLVQMVLHILARQLRILETEVEIRINMEQERAEKVKSKKKRRDESEESARDSDGRGRRMEDIQEREERSGRREKDRTQKLKHKEDRAAAKEKEREERAASKEREKAAKEHERAEKHLAKEAERADKTAAKEREKQEKAAAKEREREERAAAKGEKAAAKERDKEERATSKEREKEEKAAAKEREREERAAAKGEKAAAKERDKEERATSKEREKEEKAAAKEREREERAAAKGEKAAAKERDKAERGASKEREKEEKAAIKDREKAEKAAAKERDREERATSKEREKAEKADQKERERAEKEKGKAEKEKIKTEKEKEKAEREREKADKYAPKATKEKEGGRRTSATSIVVTEKKGPKDKVLVVEKGPTTRTDSRTRVGSIEVVTLSQFELLEATVNRLQALTGPLPMPNFPDNKKLMEDIANGTASLTDIMQAMQVSARIEAAEKAITHMADLLTQLAAAGAIPEELAEMVEGVKAEVEEVAAVAAAAAELAEAKGEEWEEEGEKEKESLVKPSSTRPRPSTAARKSVAIEPMSTRPSTIRPTQTVKSVASTVSTGSKMVPVPPVSHKEMDDALRALREDLNKAMALMTGKATTVAESASMTAKGVAEKLDVALKLNSRISTLDTLVNDYAEQLSGFDTGLTSQMQGFQEQMGQMRSDLKSGMAQLSQAGGGGETTAMMELTERYDLLVVELDSIQHEHQGLAIFQKQLGDELRTLVECVEMLREQKADRDEVQDGLRDKADISRLTGLLTEKTFASIREELERRLELCHDKFRRQENVWMSAIKDLTQILESKAELMHLLAARDEAQNELRSLHEKLHRLAEILGEPKAAILTRQLARDATCGVCMISALMNPWDESFGAPPPLPAMRPRPTGAPAEEPAEPCLQDIAPPPPVDSKAHTCHRWVGGSHTLISDTVAKEKASPMIIPQVPTKRYTGYGTDGRLYMLEEEMQPCIQCNVIMEPKSAVPSGNVPKHGAGDQGDAAGTDKKKNK